MIAHVIEHGPRLSQEPRGGETAAGRGAGMKDLEGAETTGFSILEQSREQGLPITLPLSLSAPLTVLF